MLQLGICSVRFLSALINKVSKIPCSAHLLKCMVTIQYMQQAESTCQQQDLTYHCFHEHHSLAATREIENSSERQHFVFSNVHMA